jgi:trimeric autotransporter adhesin
VSLGQDAYGLAAGAVALGKSRASGTGSFAATITNNTATYGATGANSVAIGSFSKSTGTRSTALGYFAAATGTGGVAIGGYVYGAKALTTYAVAIGCSSSNCLNVPIGWNNSISS